MATGQGTITFDFGSSPGTNVVQSVVSDSGISVDSKVEIYLMGTTGTATHNAYEHSLLPYLDSMALSCVSVMAGVGFTGQMATKLRLTGTIQARYVWAD